MRITFLVHYCMLYGANRSLLNLLDGLKVYGVEPQVIMPCAEQLLPELQKRGIKTKKVPIKWWMDKEGRERWTRLYQNIRALPHLRRAVEEFKTDLLYTNSSVIPTGAMASEWTGIPHVWHFREFGDLDYNYKFDWNNPLSRRLIRRAAARITISRTLKAHLQKRYRVTDFHVISNGIASEATFDELRDKATEQKRNGPYTFALVGTLHPAKGTETAIRAFATARRKRLDSKLILAGDGEKTFVEKCQSLCCDLGISDKVQFTGYVQDPFQIYLGSDAVLMCSPNEAMGRVTVEAMAAHRPVIGYDAAGTSELIEHGKTGLLYRNDVEGLAHAMESLLENPEMGVSIAQNAWTYARQNFSVEVYSRKVWEVISSAAKKR